MRKRLLALVLCVVICLGVLPVTAGAAARDTAFEASLAADLKELGLFIGVSSTNFDLNRAPTRLEALTMLVRVLGKEAEAMSGSWSHPFTDVPEWADKYVGYAYEHGLTDGVSPTLFGTYNATANMYLTFILRALGYSDAGGADFSWDAPYTLSKITGILPSFADTANFWRADVVSISYAALSARLKGSRVTLAEKLVDGGAFTEAQFEACYDGAAISRHEEAVESGRELNAEQVYAQCSPAVFYIMAYDGGGSPLRSGSGFFIDENGTAVTNYHVIEGAGSAVVTLYNGVECPVAGVYDYDVGEDWAVIRVEGSGFSFLEPGDSSTVAGGAAVYAIGSPLGLQSTISEGIISNPCLTDGGVNYIMTSAAISSGSSGGALINKYGDVIGITSASYKNGQNLNLALPITYVSGYSSAEVTPLGGGVGANQAAAFAALSGWVNDNYTGTMNGDRAYLETYSNDSMNYYYYLVRDSDGEFITVLLEIEYNGLYYCSYLALTPSGSSFPTRIAIFGDSSGSEPVFTGDGVIYAESFGKEYPYSFSSYSGAASNISELEDLSRGMLLDSLTYVRYVFGYFSEIYGVSDFGFNQI